MAIREHTSQRLQAEALIVAMTSNHVIGHQGALPWHIPEDLKRFRKLTLGRSVIMGRKTWDEIYQRLGKALPQRRNLVLTRRPLPAGVEAEAITSLTEAMEIGGRDSMIIGGAQIYEMFLPHARCLHLTEVFGEYEGDRFFPEFDRSQWREEAREVFPTYAFTTLVRHEAGRPSH